MIRRLIPRPPIVARSLAPRVTDVGRAHRRHHTARRDQVRNLIKRCASLVVTTLVAVCGAFALPATAHAITIPCGNGDNLNPPYNITDRCWVARTDRSTIFIAELTGGETACDPSRRTTQRQRIRVVADWVSPGKLLIRSIDIRYLSGTMPWAYYRVHVQDGNGQYFWRDWNKNGGVITSDGASRVVEDTVHLVPNPGFAPVFGRNNWVNVQVYPHFYPDAFSPQRCTGEVATARFMAP